MSATPRFGVVKLRSFAWTLRYSVLCAQQGRGWGLVNMNIFGKRASPEEPSVSPRILLPLNFFGHICTLFQAVDISAIVPCRVRM